MSLESDLKSIAKSLESLAATNQALLDLHMGDAPEAPAAAVDIPPAAAVDIPPAAPAAPVATAPAPAAPAAPAAPVATAPAVDVPPAPPAAAPAAVLWSAEAVNQVAGETAERLGGPDKVKETLTAFNAVNGISSLDPTRYADFVAALKAL